MSNKAEEIHPVLAQLVGLPLAVARRAADMRVLHFGTIRPAAVSKLPSLRNRPRGSVGDFALHIQCAWRLETADGIFTGRSDLWEPVENLTGSSYESWDYEKDGNLQDKQMEQFLSTSQIIVTSVRVQTHGAFALELSDGYRLAVFPSGSSGEDWRLFVPHSDEPHFVVSGGSIERDDAS